MSTDNLYQEILMDHARHPRNKGEIVPCPTCAASGDNAMCGDEVTVALLVVDGRVSEAKFTGSGCAISTASASMLTDAVLGKTVPEARALAEEMCELCRGARSVISAEELLAFRGVREYPMRVKCATLCWHALIEALRDQ